MIHVTCVVSKFAGRCRHRFSKDGSFRNRGMLDGSSKVHRIFFDWWTHGDLHGFTPGLQAWGRAAPKACFSQDRLGVERRAAGLSFLLWWAFELSDLECFWFICWFCCTSFSIKYPQTVSALLPNFSLPLRRRSFLHSMQPSAAFIAVCCQDPESQASCKSHCINSSCALPCEVWPMTKHQSPGFSHVPTIQAKIPWSFISVWF